MNTYDTPIIKIESLGKTFTTMSGEVKALDCVSLDIQRGEIFGIIGLSGAGKSTLVRCINFLERPTSGTVYIDGQDLSLLSPQELGKTRRNMGMIFQQFNLLMQRTALDNVCFPLELSGLSKRKARKKAKELMERVGLSDRLYSYPAQLSGGQKQRVAIARALATDPKILLCDEATSALDPTTTDSILQLLQELNREMGITVVIITHEMSVIERVCNKVAIIDESNISEVGAVSEIFSNPKSIAAKRLIFLNKESNVSFDSKNCYRIIFDGRSSFEPVIANMVLESKCPVNIMFANTKNIEGNAFGQMVIQLPDDALSSKRVLGYLNTHNITYEEVKNFV